MGLDSQHFGDAARLVRKWRRSEFDVSVEGHSLRREPPVACRKVKIEAGDSSSGQLNLQDEHPERKRIEI